MAFTAEQEQSLIALLSLLNEKKVTLSDLPVATDLNDGDIMFIRQGDIDRAINGNVLKKYLSSPEVLSKISGVLGDSGYLSIPMMNGDSQQNFTIQWGSVSAAINAVNVVYSQEVTLPVDFKNQVLTAWVSNSSTSPSECSSSISFTNDSITTYWSGTALNDFMIRWFAVGY